MNLKKRAKTRKYLRIIRWNSFKAAITAIVGRPRYYQDIARAALRVEPLPPPMSEITL
jgi:hypothetical protein